MTLYTMEKRHDGFGAQFQTILCGIITAETDGDEYVHTPIQSMEHNYDNSPDFLKEMEELMNLGAYTLSLSEENPKEIIHFQVSSLIAKFESKIEEYSKSLSLVKLKKRFRENKTNPFLEADLAVPPINVAVHIRRPNPHDCRTEGTNIPDSYYLRIMKSIRDKVDKPFLFHIYSQGKPEDFEEVFHAPDVLLHINQSLPETFLGMVMADILIMSNSSLSYSAAFLNEGEIHIPSSFWHKPFPSWIVETI